MKSLHQTLVLGCFLLTAVHASAQSPSPRNVVQFSVSHAVELPNDWMVLTLSTTREGVDAAVLQAELKQALDMALQEARPLAGSDAMQLRTGQFNLLPRHGRDGRISGWQGNAELILEGRDFNRISSIAGRIQSLTIARVAYALSKTQKTEAESGVQSQAIEQFRTRASDISRNFGFSSYTLREISIQSSEQYTQARPALRALDTRSSSLDAALPIEAGKGLVQITVTGSIQLQ